MEIHALILLINFLNHLTILYLVHHNVVLQLEAI